MILAALINPEEIPPYSIIEKLNHGGRHVE